MKTVFLTEKRLLTYSPSLAAKKRYEINRMVEKAKSLTLSLRAVEPFVRHMYCSAVNIMLFFHLRDHFPQDIPQSLED